MFNSLSFCKYCSFSNKHCRVNFHIIWSASKVNTLYKIDIITDFISIKKIYE